MTVAINRMKAEPTKPSPCVLHRNQNSDLPHNHKHTNPTENLLLYFCHKDRRTFVEEEEEGVEDVGSEWIKTEMKRDPSPCCTLIHAVMAVERHAYFIWMFVIFAMNSWKEHSSPIIFHLLLMKEKLKEKQIIIVTADFSAAIHGPASLPCSNKCCS